MTARETYDTRLDEQFRRDFVLKQPSTVGPWVALGLGLSVLVFLSSLLYVNLTSPPPFADTPAHVLRPEIETAATPGMRTRRTVQRAWERRKSVVTVVPQGRAPNALLGGHGPALPPEQGARTSSAPPASLPTLPVSGRP